MLLVIGERLSEITTAGYTLLRVPDPEQALIHVSPDPEELGRVYAPVLAVPASPDTFALALAATPPLEGSAREDAFTRAHEDYLDNLRHRPAPGALDMGDVMATSASGFPPTRSSRTARATSRSGRIASTSSGGTPPSWRRRAARWATAFLPP